MEQKNNDRLNQDVNEVEEVNKNHFDVYKILGIVLFVCGIVLFFIPILIIRTW